MSYWAGYSATALVLNEKEFDAFLEEYEKQNPSEHDKIRDILESGSLDEHAFKRSVKELPLNNIFEITRISPDDTSGAFLLPYQNNGKPNVYGEWDEDGNFVKNEDHIDISFADETCYFIAADKQLDSPLAFTEQRYGSYGELVAEFQKTIGGYLPKGFDWDRHIGSLTYAAFA